jgi:hypothetical protein
MSNATKKSKSLFGRLIQKVGQTPDKAGQFYCQVVETKTWRTNHVWSTSFVENAYRPNSPRNLRNRRQKICVNLCESVKSVVKNQSIKNVQLCETNPISEMPKMNLNPCLTSDYDNKLALLTMKKQSQTKPICLHCFCAGGLTIRFGQYLLQAG